jgi:hypothetical protein
MRNEILSSIKARKNRTISLSELERLVSGECTYSDFAHVILDLEHENVLSRIKSQGENGKTPSLAFGYRINKTSLKVNLQDQIKNARILLHPEIELEAYFPLPEEVWAKDYPFILKVDHYLRKYGLPIDKVPAPERSFELVGNEKWITEGSGEEVLRRMGLWDKLLVFPVSDPLMLAVNTSQLQAAEQIHLIVENKTTYQGLLPVLKDSIFTSLIYGCGKKIIKSIEHFHDQLPLESNNHRFYYFGDIDYEGILIWYLLSKKMNAELALPFYKECLKRPYVYGKQNQRENEVATEAFVNYFQEPQQSQIRTSLQSGGYYPQEILKTKELQHVWRHSEWN